MRFLLDTIMCVSLIRRQSAAILSRLTRLPIEVVGVSSITVAELQYGVQKSGRPQENQQALDQFLIPLAILPFDYDASIVYGRIRVYLEAQGTPIGSLDTLIAAHAVSQGLTLVTSNMGEFERVPDLYVEDWSRV